MPAQGHLTSPALTIKLLKIGWGQRIRKRAAALHGVMILLITGTPCLPLQVFSNGKPASISVAS
jgi:hypothetical protein